MQVTRQLFEDLRRRMNQEGVVLWVTLVQNPESEEPNRFHGRLNPMLDIDDYGVDVRMMDFATDANYPNVVPRFVKSHTSKPFHIRFRGCKYVEYVGCGLISIYPSCIDEIIHISTGQMPILLPYQADPQVEVVH
jgi:hypothetical protein